MDTGSAGASEAAAGGPTPPALNKHRLGRRLAEIGEFLRATGCCKLMQQLLAGVKGC